MKFSLPSKRLQISKVQSAMLIVIAVATVVTIFSLISTKALLSQAAYHRKELSAKREALKRLNNNVDAANNLMAQYQIFNSGNPNAIGGSNTSDTGAIPPDGTNSRIVLDALPSTYDFPALVSSVSKLFDIDRVINPSISGSDQSSTINAAPSASPKPVEMPLLVNATTSYSGLQNLIKDFERSIRPFDITSLQISGTSDSTSVSLSLTSYFQPAKTLTITNKEIR